MQRPNLSVLGIVITAILPRLVVGLTIEQKGHEYNGIHICNIVNKEKPISKQSWGRSHGYFQF